jgi:Response regulators consisting of a CheY-like receiver domain and a winged-helix DNA-binding domain
MILKMRILLVEDNMRFSASLAKSLEEEGYAVDAAFDGPSGESMGLSALYDLVILDVMLPGKDGFEVCRSLRSRKVATPVIMLTARDAVDDRVRGLDGGADDYLTKPFELAELRARIRALLRRESQDKSGELRVADLSLDPATHRVSRGGREISLTAREFGLLEYFLRNPDRVITREMAESRLWNQDEIVASNVVDVYVRRLRAKVDDGFEPKLLETLRGTGYRLRTPEGVAAPGAEGETP